MSIVSFSNIDPSVSKLSFVINQKSLYCFIHSKEKELLVFEELVFNSLQSTLMIEEMKDMLEKRSIFKKAFHQTFIEINRGKTPFVLIPNPLYSEDHLEDYFKPIADITHKKLVPQNIDWLDCKLIFSIDQELHRFLQSTLPSAVLGNDLYFILKNLPFIFNKFKKGVLLVKDSTHITLMYCEDLKLHFCNQFEYATGADIAYYTLLVYNEFNLDKNEISLLLAGYTENEAEETEILNHYIAKIEKWDKFIHIPSHTTSAVALLTHTL